MVLSSLILTAQPVCPPTPAGGWMGLNATCQPVAGPTAAWGWRLSGQNWGSLEMEAPLAQFCPEEEAGAQC